MTSRTFLLPDNRGHVLFVDNVLQHMYQHAQTRFWQREAGGQLFSTAPHESSVVVSVASGPHSRDAQSRHHFAPDLPLATRDREIQFNLGKHAVGLWHTHPEAKPAPSNQDYNTTQEYLEAFHGMMDGFLLVILGNSGNPLNMVVWIATMKPFGAWIQLEEI
ncbi:MAG: Mov34/MPN/PAD-1 family protein [Methylococcales bacterium]|nr:Mov34/MPN/PAD-1 family protein [Methylococcales bacterium]MDD5631021.1 Mov34/MPN/PAD-1 family protein [Methylococcales bacterium]